MNVARQLFEQTTTIADVEALAKHESEALYVDFKDLSEVRPNKPEAVRNKLREILGKAVSGFANAQGGVLFFGVKEPTTKEGETQRSVVLIPSASEFEQQVNEQLSRVASFTVDGCETKVIGDNDGGVVLVYVPEGQARPHRNTVSGKYHRRSGDSFVLMEHYEVVEMLTAAKAPQLEPRLNLRAHAKTPDGKRTEAFVIDVMAHWVRVVFQVERGDNGKNWESSKGGTEATVLYPGDVVQGSFGRFNGKAQDFGGGSFEHELNGTLEVAAKDMPTKRFKFSLEYPCQISDANEQGNDGDLLLAPNDS